MPNTYTQSAPATSASSSTWLSPSVCLHTPIAGICSIDSRILSYSASTCPVGGTHGTGQALFLTNYHFTLPTNATITAVSLSSLQVSGLWNKICTGVSDACGCTDLEVTHSITDSLWVTLTKNGSSMWAGTAAQITGIVSGHPVNHLNAESPIALYSGASLAYSDINASTFGIVVYPDSGNSTNGFDTLGIAYQGVLSVTYTTPIPASPITRRTDSVIPDLFVSVK